MPDDIVVIPTLGTRRTEEVVSYAFTPTQNTLPQSATGEALHPLSNSLIACALDGIELKYRINEDNALLPVIPGSAMICKLSIIADGVLSVFCTVPRTIPKDNWLAALLACNEYHGYHRFGRCYFSVLDDKVSAKPYFDNYIDLAAGVTKTHLERLLLLNLHGAHVVFEKIFAKHQLYADRPRTRRTTTKSKG
jgi:hypothetical protein